MYVKDLLKLLNTNASLKFESEVIVWKEHFEEMKSPWK